MIAFLELDPKSDFRLFTSIYNGGFKKKLLKAHKNISMLHPYASLYATLWHKHEWTKFAPWSHNVHFILLALWLAAHTCELIFGYINMIWNVHTLTTEKSCSVMEMWQ